MISKTLISLNILKIQLNKEIFKSYLSEIWKDLSSRTKNQNIKNLNYQRGISKSMFNNFYPLPILINNRIFSSFDKEKNDLLSKEEFVSGMLNIFLFEKEKIIELIFDIFDFDRDKLININDIKLIMLYIPLSLENYTEANSEKEVEEKILTNLKQNNLINNITFKNFCDYIKNIDDSIYYFITYLLLSRTPFNQQCLEEYNKQFNISGESNSSLETEIQKKSFYEKKEKKSMFSFNNNANSNNNLNDNNNQIYILYSNSESTKSFLSSNEYINNEKNNLSFKNLSKKVNEMNSLSNNNFNSFDSFNNIKNNINKTKSNVSEYTKEDSHSSNYKKTFSNKFNINNNNNFFFSNCNNSNNINKNDEQNYFSLGIESDNEEENQIFDLNNNVNKEEINNSEIAKISGILYKISSKDGKLKKLFYKLIGKDLYFFNNKLSPKFIGMHHLTDTFINSDFNPIYFKSFLLYPFSLTYSSKESFYYTSDLETRTKWVNQIKLAIKYEDIYEKYILENQIGKGHFGVVYLGLNKINNLKVAIKILNKENMDETDIFLVKKEIEILKICKNIGRVVHLYNHYETAKKFFLVFEYCSGNSLYDYLYPRNFNVSESDAKTIIYHLSSVIYDLELYGICHRDLKIENILLNSNNDIYNLRLTDFGLSCIIGPNEKKNEPYGTLTYVAPEVLKREPYSFEVDLWSLGIITYLLLAGRLPFNNEDNNILMNNIINIEPNYEILKFKNISNEGINFVKGLLEKNVKKRLNINQVIEHPWLKDFQISREKLYFISTYFSSFRKM